MRKETFLKQIETKVVPYLESHGFHGKGENYCRIRHDFVDCVYFQKRSDGSAYAVNLGVQPRFSIMRSDEELTLLQPDCEIKYRLAEKGETDKWWPSGTPEKSAMEIRRLLESDGFEFFDFFSSIAESLADLTQEDIESGNYPQQLELMTRVRLTLLVSKANVAIGNLEKALFLARYGLQIAGMAVNTKRDFRAIIKEIE